MMIPTTIEKIEPVSEASVSSDRRSCFSFLKLRVGGSRLGAPWFSQFTRRGCLCERIHDLCCHKFEPGRHKSSNMTALTSARESPSTWPLKFPLPANRGLTLKPLPFPLAIFLACLRGKFDQFGLTRVGPAPQV